MSLQPSKSPPPPSYPLTPLDHLIYPLYLGGVSTFDLRGKDRHEALRRLEVAATRLASHLPFLDAYIVPAPETDGKVNGFEVRSGFECACPFYQAQEHPASTALLIDGRLNPAFLPTTDALEFPDPCPVLRLKANMAGDALHLVYYFHHTAMDGMGGTVVGKTLAQLCRNPDTPASELPTTAAEQRAMREKILTMGASSTPRSLRWQPKPPHFPLFDMENPGNRTANRRFRIRAEKVHQIRQACQTLLQAHAYNGTQGVYLSTSLIIGALFGICAHRARHAAGLGEWFGATFEVAFNLRKQLNLPSTYMGNAVVTVGCSLDAQLLPSGTTGVKHAVPGVTPDEIQRLCNVMLAILQDIQSYSPDNVAGMLGTLSALTDRSSVRASWNGLAFSDTHNMDFYHDYGPLGEVQDFALPGNELGGVCWLLASKPSSRGYYELQVALEHAAMEKLEKESLFHWATCWGPRTSKL
ncbi:hypothetical protein BDW62DRAFT_202965 [Aspergillus aurantiobrunneus]